MFDSGSLSRRLMDLFKQLLHKRYQAVDPGRDESVFGREEDDGSDELSIEKLSRLHNVLLSQAQDTISSTEDQVSSLRAERLENEAAESCPRAGRTGTMHGQRTPCCGWRARCVIL